MFSAECDFYVALFAGNCMSMHIHLKQGFLNLQLPPWKRVMLTRTVAMVPTVAIALLQGETLFASSLVSEVVSPSYLLLLHISLGSKNKLIGLDDWINVCQSLQLPFALFPLVHFTTSPRLMGQFANKKWMSALCWLLALIVCGVNFYLVIISFQQQKQSGVLIAVAVILMVPYGLFSGYLAFAPMFKSSKLSRLYEPADEQIEPLISDEGGAPHYYSDGISTDSLSTSA